MIDCAGDVGIVFVVTVVQAIKAIIAKIAMEYDHWISDFTYLRPRFKFRSF